MKEPGKSFQPKAKAVQNKCHAPFLLEVWGAIWITRSSSLVPLQGNTGIKDEVGFESKVCVVYASVVLHGILL